jgi:hypothetical protein
MAVFHPPMTYRYARLSAKALLDPSQNPRGCHEVRDLVAVDFAAS